MNEKPSMEKTIKASLKGKMEELLTTTTVLLLILLIILVARYNSACDIVLNESFQGIRAATDNLSASIDNDNMSDKELQEMMQNYGLSTINHVQSINGIAGKICFYKGYKLDSFESFIMDELFDPYTDHEELQNNYTVISQIDSEITYWGANSEDMSKKIIKNHCKKINELCRGK